MHSYRSRASPNWDKELARKKVRDLPILDVFFANLKFTCWKMFRNEDLSAQPNAAPTGIHLPQSFTLSFAEALCPELAMHMFLLFFSKQPLSVVTLDSLPGGFPKPD